MTRKRKRSARKPSGNGKGQSSGSAVTSKLSTGKGGSGSRTASMRQSGNQGGSRARQSGLVVFGLHAARAALENPKRRVQRVMVTKRAEAKLEDALRVRAGICRKHGWDCAIVPSAPAELDAYLGDDAVHQGVALEVIALAEPDEHDIYERLAAGDAPLVMVLDQVTDPHNVGAIVRSCAVFGVDALVMTDRNSPPLGGVLAKAASGGLEHVPVLKVTNLARTLDDLKASGFVAVGLDGDAGQTLGEAMLADRPVALVMGAEEKGLRRLTRERCDQLARIPAYGPIRSLNVSNAAAVALSTLRRSFT